MPEGTETNSNVLQQEQLGYRKHYEASNNVPVFAPGDLSHLLKFASQLLKLLQSTIISMRPTMDVRPYQT
jgi:hypothetical protein